MVRKLRSPKPLSIAKNERKRIEVWLFFKMGLQCDAHKHRNHGWWILNRKSRIPDHKQSTCLWDQGPQSSKEKMTGHSQGSHCPECAWIWQLSTPVQQRVLPMFLWGIWSKKTGGKLTWLLPLPSYEQPQAICGYQQTGTKYYMTKNGREEPHLCVMPKKHWTFNAGERHSQLDAGILKLSSSHKSS